MLAVMTMSTGRLSRYRRARRQSGERGVVLILAVFAAVLLSVLAVGITTAVRVELLASRTSLDRMQSLFLAQAGVSEARALLLYDDPGVDSLLDSWGSESELQLDLPNALGPGYYRVRVHDACGRIDVNEADDFMLARVTGDPTVAAAIVDWRDRGSMQSSDGAEQEFYAALGSPYAPRNGPFQTLGELLLVRGVTPEMFFGGPDRVGLVELLTVDSTSTNRTAEGAQRLDLNSFRNWGEQGFRDAVMAKLGSIITMYEATEIWRGFNDLVSAGQDGYTALGQLVTVAGLDPAKVAQLVDHVAVGFADIARGAVNVNTAPLDVLMALPGSSQDIAAAVAERRYEEPFGKLSEVARLLLNQRNGEVVFIEMIDHLTTRSSTFIIESMGWTESGRAFRTVRALVRRSPDDVVVLHQSEQDWPLPPPDGDLIPAQYGAAQRGAARPGGGGALHGLRVEVSRALPVRTGRQVFSYQADSESHARAGQNRRSQQLTAGDDGSTAGSSIGVG